MQNREKLVLLFYTIFNIISNKFVPFYSDEAYYWVWSKKLALSYFDHPPMVAYIIKLTTLFSDDVLFVRLGSALLVSGTLYTLYKLAKLAFDEKTAVYSFYIFISSIITIAASTLITPDIPLMFFTSVFLYFAYKYTQTLSLKDALFLGISAGAMMLSKYPAVLIIFTVLVYAVLYKREVFKDKSLYIASFVALLVFSPVLYWNYANDFISFTFQINHGIAEEKVFKPDELMNFLGAQFVLFHPFYLLPLLYFIIRDKERFEQKKVYFLLSFLFPIIFFSYFSAFKYANAQWAALAYLSATILLGYYFAKFEMKKLLTSAMILSGVIVILLKTPLGIDNLKPIEQLFSRLGKIQHFDKEIQSLHLDLKSYKHILIDDYHGSEVAYYLKKTDNLLVLTDARFSNFNIWREQENNITKESPLKKIPHLGKCLYIGTNTSHIEELKKLFDTSKQLGYFEKKVSFRTLKYHIVEFKN